MLKANSNTHHPPLQRRRLGLYPDHQRLGNEIQLVCPGQPAGSFYTHEGVLYYPLFFGLITDAKTSSNSWYLLTRIAIREYSRSIS